LDQRVERLSAASNSCATSGKSPEHGIQRLNLKYSEALVGIGRVHPILPVFRTGSSTFVLNVVDFRQERRRAAAGIGKRDPVRMRLSAVQDVENRIALGPGKSVEYFRHSVTVVDD